MASNGKSDHLVARYQPQDEHRNVFENLKYILRSAGPAIRCATKIVPKSSLVIVVVVCLFLYYQPGRMFWNRHPDADCQDLLRSVGNREIDLDASSQYVAFPSPESDNFPRLLATIDTFENYKYRNHSDASCQISSLDLHKPFAPLCADRQSLLAAISGGGRIGFETPFMSRDCDMSWHTTRGICEIFARFEKVIVVGDSMMRHVVGALNVLLRQDLGYGAVTGWNFNDEELRQCFCNSQFDVKACSVQGIFTTESVRQNDPDSLACTPEENIDLVIEMMLRFPLDPDEVSRFQALLSPTKPRRPYAFIFGHGLWNDLDLQATENWLDGILAATLQRAPYLPQALWPRLFVSPNAAGLKKPDQWIQSQGDKALQMFEHGSREMAAEKGVEHLGTWNMSIQAGKYDGVHLDLRGNLVKAMSVVNWLGLVDVERW